MESVLDYPPFPGFSEEGMKFLRSIKKNNRREWLTEERKERLDHELIFPMKTLLAECGRNEQLVELGWNPDPARGIFRIYRDVRFSKNKNPFKTHIGGVIPYRDEGRKGIGAYLHIEPGHSFFGGGAYFLESDQLRALRGSIDADPSFARKLLNKLSSDFAPVQGEQLKRMPKGFEPSHPAEDLLRYKQMWVSRALDDQEIGSEQLVDTIAEWCQTLHPFIDWLYSSVHGQRT